MNADDDGFVEHFMVMRMTGASSQDLGVLEINNLIKIFDDNVLFIRDWKENNYIQRDRYCPSKYLGIYNLDTKCIQNVDTGKDSIGKVSIGKDIYIVEQVVNYLNERTRSDYKSTSKKTKDLINARINEGFKLDDFKKVIDNKVYTWGKDKKMVQFLRPETLFSNKFEGYLNEKIIQGGSVAINMLAEIERK
jgi:uncharacterized phage protein (TIGR02220 family)